MSEVLKPTGHRRFLHWLTALLIIVMLILGVVMTRAVGLTPEAIETSLFRFSLHKTIGVIVLALAIWRLLAMFTGRPLKTANHPPLEVIAAISVQTYFLCAMVALPITGLIQHYYATGAAPIWILPGGGFHATEGDPAMVARLGQIHGMLAWTLMAALLAHIGGALKHHLFDKDNTLVRMVSGRDRTSTAHDDARAPGIWTGLGRAAGLAGFAAILALGIILPTEDGPSTALAQSRGEWVMVPEDSRLVIKADQQGTPFEAEFTRFAADITLNPDDLANASVSVEIDSGSFSSGLPDRDNTVKNAAWMDVSAFPVAHWRSSQVTQLDDGRYQADGELEIRGIGLAVPLIFTLTIDGDKAHAVGEANFDRFAIELGRGPNNAEAMAGPTIGVSFEIHAVRGDLVPEAAPEPSDTEN